MRVVAVGVVNILLTLFLALLLEGLMRKIKAVIHSRQGPPLLQPYYDLGKLLVKADCAAASDFVYRSAPAVCLGSVLLAALFTPMGTEAPLYFAGDAIVLVYLLTMSAVCIILGGMASGSPFAYIGSAREMMLLLVVEPVLVITLLTGAVKAQSLMVSDITRWVAVNGYSISLAVGAVAFFLAIQAELAKVPFDLAEAETELMEGPLIEYSGRKLALLKWALYAKQIVFVSLFLEVFFPWPKSGVLLWDGTCYLLKVLLVITAVEVVEAINPRLKIEHAIQYFTGVIVFALTGLAFAVFGL